MSNYTYESKDIKTPLETYEWDNVWWEHADKDDNSRAKGRKGMPPTISEIRMISISALPPK